MRTHVGGLPVEITRPESAKFHHPLLLLHGLWTDSWIWQPFATYLAHRGWESWAPSLAAVPGAEVVRALDDVIRALPGPPVIVAHDVGVLTAASCAQRAAVPAIVAIAPLVPSFEINSERGLFAWPQFWRARLAGARVSPPRGAGARAFLGGALAVRDQLRADSGATFRAIASGRTCLPARLDVPGLVLGGERDVIAPDPALRALAARFGWTRRAYPGRGHFAILEPGWEALADDVHRWVVQTVGAELLAFLDDDPDLPDPL
jgi:pimeloyl-ACP methyl ester carboxylesterase